MGKIEDRLSELNDVHAPIYTFSTKTTADENFMKTVASDSGGFWNKLSNDDDFLQNFIRNFRTIDSIHSLFKLDYKNEAKSVTKTSIANYKLGSEIVTAGILSENSLKNHHY